MPFNRYLYRTLDRRTRARGIYLEAEKRLPFQYLLLLRMADFENFFTIYKVAECYSHSKSGLGKQGVEMARQEAVRSVASNGVGGGGAGRSTHLVDVNTLFIQYYTPSSLQ